MNRHMSAALLAASSFSVLAPAALAQSTSPGDEAPPATQDRSQSGGNLADAEIIVTARRQEERLIDVPQTVNAVTSEDLQKRNILTFEDLNSVVAGLNLSTGSLGYDSTATVRGVAYDPTSETSSTVQGYVNEVPTSLTAIFQALFDVGQIEILRGPQGTLRGRSAPTGAFTMTTRRPDLHAFGGYVSATGSTPRGVNLQGAVGMPIIKDVLALRVAGVFDRNAAGNIKSVNNPDNPYAQSEAGRATALFEPTSDLRMSLMYQNQHFRSEIYGPIVFGSGAPEFFFPGFPPFLPALVIPAGFNGPALTPDDRRSVVDFPNILTQRFETITGQVDWSFAGQELHYVGGVVWNRFNQLSDVDPYNTQPTRGPGFSSSKGRNISHEIRLNSVDRIRGYLDYTIGYFNNKSKSSGETLFALGGGLPGAFGPPSGPFSPINLNRDYAYSPFFPTSSSSREQGLFGTATLHLGERTEFSVGGRQIWLRDAKEAPFRTFDTFLAIETPDPCTGVVSGFVPGFGTPYTNAPLSPSPYPGTCNVLLTDGNGLAPFFASLPLTKSKFSPFVWNASASHKLSPDLMVYATYGTSWRAGPQGIIGAPLCDTCDQFSFLNPETSKSIELGVKGALLDRRLTFSIAAYDQRYKNYVARADNVRFRQCIEGGNCVLPDPASLTYNAPIKVRGVDLDIGYRATDDLSAGLAFSYARARFANASIPCRDGNFDGVADEIPPPSTADDWLAAGGPVSGPAFCSANGPASSTPPWNLVLRAEYAPELTTNLRGFIRGTFNYTPKNENRRLLNAAFVPEAYGLVDLFAGLRSKDGAWEISVSARNLLNDQTVLNRDSTDATFVTSPFSLFGASTGYRSISFVQRRQFQLSVRYAFGSR
jgi:Outer membrane receptor proteins, mostly Fe transport